MSAKKERYRKYPHSYVLSDLFRLYRDMGEGIPGRRRVGRSGRWEVISIKACWADMLYCLEVEADREARRSAPSSNRENDASAS
jgi:hypothetical protein